MIDVASGEVGVGRGVTWGGWARRSSAMELAALAVAVLAFGWPVLLVGAPLLVGTLVVLAVVRLWELVRQRRERRGPGAGTGHRATRA